MTQDEIDKLMAGREIFDRYRSGYEKQKAAIKVEFDIMVDSDPDTPVFTAAKSAMNTMLADDNIDLKNELLGIGFGSGDLDPLADLKSFNDLMCLTEVENTYTILGECDLCAGYNGTPPCVVAFGDRGCAVSDEDRTRGYIPFVFLRRIKYGYVYPKTGKINTFCPDGHGFYGYGESLTDPRFDVLWRVDGW